MNESPERPQSPVDPADLVRKFDAGDRSAALMDALNRAAFVCFHAPWEEEPPQVLRFRDLPFQSESTRGEDLHDLQLDAPGTEELIDAEEAVPRETKALLHHLYSLGHRVFIDGLLSLRVELPYDPVADCNAVVAIEVDPCDGLLRFRTGSDLRDATWNPVRARLACTKWTRRMPRMKGALQTPKGGDEEAGERLVAEGRLQLDSCLEGLGPFTEAIGNVLQNCQNFWRFARVYLRHAQPPQNFG